MKNNFEITLKHDTAVMIKESSGRFASYYPYNPICEYVEVSCDFSRKNFKVTEWHFCLKRSENDTLANWYSEENITNYVSEKSIKAAKKELVKHIKGIKAELESGKNHPVYSAMEVIACDYISYYQDDFYYHDTLQLARNNPNKFLWFVRSTGTWLITGKNDWSKSTVEYATTKEKHFIYWYDGKELKQIKENEVMDYYNRLPVS
jgi:hypothetical protein